MHPQKQPVLLLRMFHCLVNVAVRLIGAVRVLRTGLRLFGVRALLAALLLWLLPGLGLLGGAGLLLVLTRRRRPELALSEAERQRLAALQAEEEP